MDERVRNGGLAGAVAFLVIVGVGVFAPDIAAQLPTGVEAALTTVFSTFIAWLIPRSPHKAPS
jgi:hypothetical protein